MKNKICTPKWIVKNYDVNCNQIVSIDILPHRLDFLKKLKKKYPDKAVFAERLIREMQWQFLGRSEYELILKITEDNHIWLIPWCGCSNPDEVKIDVTTTEEFNWVGFTEWVKAKHKYWHADQKVKIDIFDQITYQKDAFVDYCWEIA